MVGNLESGGRCEIAENKRMELYFCFGKRIGNEDNSKEYGLLFLA